MVDHEVVPEGTGLDSHSALDEEREQGLNEKVLFVERCVGEVDSLNNLVLRVVPLVLLAWNSEIGGVLHSENLSFILRKIEVNGAIMLCEQLLNIIDLGKWRSLPRISDLNEGY